MKTIALDQPLIQGEHLTRDEFVSRWDATPNLKYAELIGGIVIIRRSMSEEHGGIHMPISMWVGSYEMSTPGCKGNIGSSWFMRDDLPQAETSLRVLPDFGGLSSLLKRKGWHYLVGAPEFIAEISLSSTAHDMKVKKELYRKAGVQEYLCVQAERNTVTWWRLENSQYVALKTQDGVLRSVVFPGLWLDVKALLNDDKARLMNVLQDGLRSPEHAEFVVKLAKAKKANDQQ